MSFYTYVCMFMHTHAYTHTQFFFLILSHTVPTEQEVPLSQHKLDGIPGKKKESD